MTVLSTLDGEPQAIGLGQQRGRGAAEVGVVCVQLRLVARRPVVQQAAGVGRKLEHAVTPIGRPVEGPLPVATRIRRVPGSITAPARAQIAESLAAHERGWISARF